MNQTITRNITVYPSRITITPIRKKTTMDSILNARVKAYCLLQQKALAIQNFKATKNPFIISKASKKKIMDSINAMYVLSPPRKITMKTGKFIYNFRMSFITLTLPSAQKHDDTFIKSECLNQFLVEIRKHYGVKNYVWKAELQRNQNIHFHLILDKYIDFQALRRRWNRCLNKHGYVDAYQEKMQKLTLKQYYEQNSRKGCSDFSVFANRYNVGKRCGWLNPNSVDVRSIYSKKDLAVYLSKYITKPVAKHEKCSATLERELSFGRSWSRSYSLAQLKYTNKACEFDWSYLIKYLRSIPEKVKTVISEWYEVFYFNVTELSNDFKKFHKIMMLSNAKASKYPIPDV